MMIKLLLHVFGPRFVLSTLVNVAMLFRQFCNVLLFSIYGEKLYAKCDIAPSCSPLLQGSRGESLLKIAYVIFVILKSHDFSLGFFVILVISSDFFV